MAATLTSTAIPAGVQARLEVEQGVIKVIPALVEAVQAAVLDSGFGPGEAIPFQMEEEPQPLSPFRRHYPGRRLGGPMLSRCRPMTTATCFPGFGRPGHWLSPARPGAKENTQLADCPRAVDPTFGSGGKVLADVIKSGISGSDSAAGVAVQHGKIVAVGQSIHSGNSDVALLRYHANGSLDETFGSGGRVTIDLGSASDAAKSVVIQPDGKIVVGALGPSGVTLARFGIDGALDTTFGSDGKVTTGLGSVGELTFAVALQADGKVTVHGFPGETWTAKREMDMRIR